MEAPLQLVLTIVAWWVCYEIGCYAPQVVKTKSGVKGFKLYCLVVFWLLVYLIWF